MDKHLGGLWEFPGGKVENNESWLQALAREIKEELNLEIGASEFFKQVDFNYPSQTVCLRFYIVSQFSGTPKGLEGQALNWVSIKDLNQYRFPEANQKIVQLLKNQSVV